MKRGQCFVNRSYTSQTVRRTSCVSRARLWRALALVASKLRGLRKMLSPKQTQHESARLMLCMAFLVLFVTDNQQLSLFNFIFIVMQRAQDTEFCFGGQPPVWCLARKVRSQQRPQRKTGPSLLARRSEAGCFGMDTRGAVSRCVRDLLSDLSCSPVSRPRRSTQMGMHRTARKIQHARLYAWKRRNSQFAQGG